MHGTVHDISDRKRAEETMKLLPQRILVAQEAERQRVARELHDGVGQLLAGARYRLHEFSTGLAGAPQTRAWRAGAMIDHALAEVRRISHGLRPSELDDLGLAAALRALAAEFRVRTDLTLTLRLPRASSRQPPGIAQSIYRIVQEALTNIERHAHARQAQIVVRCTKNLVSLRIRDDGRGFAAANPGARKPAGLGLLHMRERTELAGGTFSLQSEPGRGTAIRAHFPLNGETNAR